MYLNLSLQHWVLMSLGCAAQLAQQRQCHHMDSHIIRTSLIKDHLVRTGAVCTHMHGMFSCIHSQSDLPRAVVKLPEQT